MAFDHEYIPPHPQSPGPAYPPRRPQPSRVSPWLTPLLTLLTLCGLLILGTLLWREYKAHQETQARNLYGTPRTIAPRGDLSGIEKTGIAISKKTKPSVAHIHVAAGAVTKDGPPAGVVLAFEGPKSIKSVPYTFRLFPVDRVT